MKIDTRFAELLLGSSPFRHNATSVDITASTVVCREDVEFARNIDVRTRSPLRTVQMEEMERDGFVVVPPQQSVIVQNNEYLELTPDVCGFYQAVGSLNTANIGVIGSVWIQPAWQGHLRLTLHNYNYNHSFTLYRDSVIGQIVLLNLSGENK